MKNKQRKRLLVFVLTVFALSTLLSSCAGVNPTPTPDQTPTPTVSKTARPPLTEAPSAAPTPTPTPIPITHPTVVPTEIEGEPVDELVLRAANLSITLKDGLFRVEGEADPENTHGFVVHPESGGNILLDHMRAQDGCCVLSDPEELYRLTVELTQKDAYLGFKIVNFTYPESFGRGKVEVRLNRSSTIQAVAYDYMTTILPSAATIHVLSFDWLWDRASDDPFGGFALFRSTSEDEYDDAILHIWGDGFLPHSKVEDWSYETACRWVDDWCETFRDQSVLYIDGNSVDELKTMISYAEKMDAKFLYLMTDVWQNGGFWPTTTTHVGVGAGSAFKTEEALIEFSRYAHEKGLGIVMHSLSGAIGLQDPVYALPHLYNDIAAWVNGTLVSLEGNTLIFKPDNPDDVMPAAASGATTPIGHLTKTLGSWFQYNYFLMDGELLRASRFTKTEDGNWEIWVARRANGTASCHHNPGDPIKGVLVPFDTCYVPDEKTSFMAVIAEEQGEFLNRVGVDFIVFDGCEIHKYNGERGFSKYATILYETADHPLMTWTSNGRVPLGGFTEQLLYRVRALCQSRCGDHNDGRPSIRLERTDTTTGQPRASSKVIEAHFMLSQVAAVNGSDFSLCRPDPMFGLTEKELLTYGRTEEFFRIIKAWKACSAVMTEKQRKILRDTLIESYAECPGRFASNVAYQLSETDEAYVLTPISVLLPDTKLKFHMKQESGMYSPVASIKNGEEQTLKNRFETMRPDLILRYLPGCKGTLSSLEIRIGSGTLSVSTELEPGQYIEIMGGSAGVYDANWNFVRPLEYTVSDDYLAVNGSNTVCLRAQGNDHAAFELQLITSGEPVIVNK